MPLLETSFQQRVAAEEIRWDPWKQDQVYLLFRKQQATTMILWNLRIFSQNVRKNHLVINTILESQSHFDIVLIQEPPWSFIRKVPSSSNSEGEDLIGTVHHPNWLLFTCSSKNRLNPSRVSAYINIHLSSLHFSLWSDIINHTDILLLSFINAHIPYFIMNIYSNSSHSALKYLKDTEVNIDNVLIMIGNFNIRDSLWDTSFPHHSSISNDLLIIADSFNLTLLSPTNPCPTRYSDTEDISNSVLNLMFLRYGSNEINQHYIYPDWYLLSDHAPLSIFIPIMDEVVNTSKLLIQPNSKQETTFVEEVTLIFKNLDSSNITDKVYLENMVNHLNSLIDQAWNKNAKWSKLTKHSKQ